MQVWQNMTEMYKIMIKSLPAYSAYCSLLPIAHLAQAGFKKAVAKVKHSAFDLDHYKMICLKHNFTLDVLMCTPYIILKNLYYISTQKDLYSGEILTLPSKMREEIFQTSSSVTEAEPTTFASLTCPVYRTSCLILISSVRD